MAKFVADVTEYVHYTEYEREEDSREGGSIEFETNNPKNIDVLRRYINGNTTSREDRAVENYIMGIAQDQRDWGMEQIVNITVHSIEEI